MLLHDDKIIATLTTAFESGMNVPKTFFREEDIEGLPNIHKAGPIWVQKPDGIEFAYMIYWSGRKFRGGYVSLNNNYSGVQRGRFERNGETLLCAHIPELKRAYKKLLPESGWIIFNFIMSDEGKIYFWGRDNIEHYKTPIEIMTGIMFEDLEEVFRTDGKLKKPEGYVASAMIFDRDNNPMYIETSYPAYTITKVWQNFYDNLRDLDKTYNFTIGLEQYMRKAYAMLQNHNKIY